MGAVRIDLRRRPSIPETPRERPRRAEGLFAPTLRLVFAPPYRAALAGLTRAGVKPDHLTLASLGASVAAAVLLARGWRFVPAFVLLVSGLFDVFDGAVARARGESSARGAWFDSVVDRLSDGAVLSGLFLSLAAQGRDRDAALALGALTVSFGVSYVRARAQALGAPLGEGMFARAERVVVLMVGLTQPGALAPALAALIVLGGVTFVQRALGARAALT